MTPITSHMMDDRPAGQRGCGCVSVREMCILAGGAGGDIETCFRDTKQLTGMRVCQCRVPQAMERHVALVLLAFVVLQQARLDPSQTVGEVKPCLHLRVIRGGMAVAGMSISHPRPVISTLTRRSIPSSMLR